MSKRSTLAFAGWRIAITAATTAVATVFAITQASALTQENDLATATSSSSSGPWKCAENVYAEVCFSADGDWFRVKDNLADSHSAVGYWSVRKPDGTTIRYGYIYNQGGNGSVRYKNKDLPEGQGMLIRPCRGHWNSGSDPTNCTGDFWVTTSG